MELINLTIYFLRTYVYAVETQLHSPFLQPEILSFSFFDKVAKYLLHWKTALEHVEDASWKKKMLQ